MLFTRSFLAVCLSWLLVLGGSHLPAAEGEEAGRAQIVRQQTQRILAALDKPADLQVADEPLSEVLAALGDRLGVNIYLDARALEDYGIGTDTPITMKLTGISGRSILDLLLRQLDLDWSVRDGLLWISTPEELEAELVTRTYPVGDLIRVAHGAEDDYDYDSLISAIRFSIKPDSWAVVGGPGSIEGIYGALVVSHVRGVHEQIAQLLAGCRDLARQLSDRPGTVPAPLALDAAGSQRIRAELDRVVTIKSQNTPLPAAVHAISGMKDIPIVIDTRALEDYGIGTDTPVTFEMTGLPLGNALRILLRELELTWVVRNEVLLITTREQAQAMLQVVVYPVEDLVVPMMGADRERYLDDLTPGGNHDFDGLRDAIAATIAPESWDEVGGAGAIQTLRKPSALVISQTDEVHEQIHDLLSRMRDAKSQEQRRLGKETQEEDAPSNYFMKAYPLASRGDQPIALHELVELIHVALGPEVWNQDQVLLRTVGQSIVIRHTPQVHRKIQRLLRELKVWRPATRAFGGNSPSPGAQPQGGFGGGGPGRLRGGYF